MALALSSEGNAGPGWGGGPEPCGVLQGQEVAHGVGETLGTLPQALCALLNDLHILVTTPLGRAGVGGGRVLKQ